MDTIANLRLLVPFWMVMLVRNFRHHIVVVRIPVLLDASAQNPVIKRHQVVTTHATVHASDIESSVDTSNPEFPVLRRLRKPTPSAVIQARNCARKCLNNSAFCDLCFRGNHIIKGVIFDDINDVHGQ